MYIVQFIVEDVPVEEVLMDEQQNTMEREPHELLHDIFFFYMKLYILFQF